MAQGTPEVSGVLATQVHFDGDSRERMAAAGIELLSACTASGAASEADWRGAAGKCNIRITIPTPRQLTAAGKMWDVDEIMISFPLATGRVWVKSQGEYTWFAKWPCDQRLTMPIQQLLQLAMPDQCCDDGATLVGFVDRPRTGRLYSRGLPKALTRLMFAFFGPCLRDPSSDATRW
jgi:hypothetical protein